MQQKEMPRLTEDELPSTQRDWKDVRRRLALLEGEWAIVEEGVSRNRSTSVRATLARYDDVEVRTRLLNGGITVYARSVTP